MSIYQIQNKKQYDESVLLANEKPEEFWGNIAKENFSWKKPFSKVLDFNFEKADFKWFGDGELNITENCIDRHLEKNADDIALIFEPNHPDDLVRKITYQNLHDEVCRMSNVLKNKGVRKGDRVCIYLPMIPELAFSVLACARIGAVHSVVFAGFSSQALSSRINDCQAKLIITSDGGLRGDKTINLKSIVDEALDSCECAETVLVVEKTKEKISMEQGRDFWLSPLIKEASTICPAETMNAEDPLFILYTSGSTGKPKGMLHTCGGYMVYSAYTFANVFQYQEGDIHFCTADIGWITGHSYILYGPLLNKATSVMFEGVPSYPDYGRFWQIVEKHKVNQFYTAPTAIRALAKQSLDFVKGSDLSSLKVLGSVGEPINLEAWEWYDENIGKGKCDIVDTWWQTETGGVMISNLPKITTPKPCHATLPIPGVQIALLGKNGKEIDISNEEGGLCVKSPWPGMARSIWGDHKRYKETYFSAFEGKYFSGDGATRDENGNYRITGRMDDVIIVSGHNLGTAPLENAINEHLLVAESAVVGFPHDIKGNALYGYLCLKNAVGSEEMKKEINQLVSEKLGPIFKLDKIQFVNNLPKTRSGKIMRRILRKIACNDFDNLGDTSTLLNPECIAEIIEERL